MAPGALLDNTDVPHHVPTKKTDSRLPVTLLSGFLGSGKTTLLENILTSPDHGLRIGVIVNDVGALNIDAALLSTHDVTRKDEQVVAMQNGCICCTLRGDLLEEVARLAQEGRVEYLVIESSGVSEPMQVAETFSEEFAEMHIAAGHDLETEDQGDIEANKRLAAILKAGGLSRVARLDTCVTLVDAVNFMQNFNTADFLVVHQTEWVSEDDMEIDEDGQEEDDDIEVDDDDEQPQLNPKARLAAKMADPTFGPLLRSKGFLWLASRPVMFGEWSQAGVMLTISGGDRWRCEVPKEEWPTDPDVVRAITRDFEGKWEDRRQELVFIGQQMRSGGEARLRKALDDCLLDEDEFAQWEAAMESDDPARRLAELFEDGFEDWPDASHEGHGHDGHKH